MKDYNGMIIVMAFPDTFVKMSDELMCKLLPLVGLGTSIHIKAGHAALVLIENATGEARYFDFGRYITPKGNGRVRSAKTDVELQIPFRARIENGNLRNLEEFLLWLDAHPEKTHGSGRLVASLCEDVNYEKALSYILGLQARGSLPYKAFGKKGSNCSRFVTETMLATTQNPKIVKGLQWNKKFTPSTVGNVEKCAGASGIFEVFDGKVSEYGSSAFKENLTNYFDKDIPEALKKGVTAPVLPKTAQLLDGIGGSAYFQLNKNKLGELLITRYTETGKMDFRGSFSAPKSFDTRKPYRFIYDSNCSFCTVEQGEIRFRLELIEDRTSTVNSAQKARSA